jgi:hypothetical protein
VLFNYLRLLYSDNGVLTDRSLDNQDETINITLSMVVNEDYIYIGKLYPFNNFFIKSTVANDVASIMTVQYWDGKIWQSAIDLLDGTSVGGVSLAQSGIVQFVPQKDTHWQRLLSTKENNAPTELNTKEIYNLYWIRIKFSASLKATTSINTISYAFTRSQRLDNIDYAINAYKTSFGVTTWDDQILTGSLHVVSDLKSRGLVLDSGQILMFDDVELPTCYKTLQIIFQSLGPSYVDKRDYYESKYKETISSNSYTFDQNDNAKVEIAELNTNTARLVR